MGQHDASKFKTSLIDLGETSQKTQLYVAVSEKNPSKNQKDNPKDTSERAKDMFAAYRVKDQKKTEDLTNMFETGYTSFIEDKVLKTTRIKGFSQDKGTKGHSDINVKNLTYKVKGLQTDNLDDITPELKVDRKILNDFKFTNLSRIYTNLMDKNTDNELKFKDITQQELIKNIKFEIQESEINDYVQKMFELGSEPIPKDYDLSSLTTMQMNEVVKKFKDEPLTGQLSNICNNNPVETDWNGKKADLPKKGSDKDTDSFAFNLTDAQKV